MVKVLVLTTETWAYEVDVDQSYLDDYGAPGNGDIDEGMWREAVREDQLRQDGFIGSYGLGTLRDQRSTIQYAEL